MSSFDPQPPAQPQRPSQQYAQPQQPVQQPQYAQPQYAQPQQQPHVAQTPPYAAPRQAPRAPGGLNVPGIVALLVLLLTTLTPLVTPVIYNTAARSGSLTAATIAVALVHVLLLLIAGALAIIGLLTKHLTRWRWAAIGAAVSVAIGLVSFALSWFSSWLVGIPGLPGMY